jgi:hypothetical protein
MQSNVKKQCVLDIEPLAVFNLLREHTAKAALF